MVATSPIKVSPATDELLTEASHFLGRSKKDIVDVAVREYVDQHRDEITAGVRASLERLDGTRASLIGEVTGLSRERLEELGGFDEA